MTALDPSIRQGVLFPERLPTFERFPPGAAAELATWFWVSRWDLPDGHVSRQELLPFPTLNLGVEDGVVGLAGPAPARSTKELAGTGWAVAALLRPAAVPALTADPAALRDASDPLDLPDLHAAVAARMPTDPAGGVAVLSTWLRERVGEPTADGLLANRMVDVLGDREVTSLADACARLAVSERTLHRLAARHVGLTPGAVLRRRRLQEAAELVRHEPDVDLAEIAASLGYTDQAHLTQDFRRVLGFTPGAYRRAGG